MIEQQHSRLPVYEGEPEKIVGILHYKDLLPVWEERRRAIRAGRPTAPFASTGCCAVTWWCRKPSRLPQMLEEFRQGRSHMAMVVDEFGTIVGMLTVEDVLEQMVGRIEDEHDEKAGPSRRRGRRGGTGRRHPHSRPGERVRHRDPRRRRFRNAGRLPAVPARRDPQGRRSVEYEGRRYTVLEMERNRIARVRIEKTAGRQRRRPAPRPTALEFVARHAGALERVAARYTWTAALVLLLLFLVYLVRTHAVRLRPGAAVRLPAVPAGRTCWIAPFRGRTRTPALALAYVIFRRRVVVLVGMQIGSRVVEQAQHARPRTCPEMMARCEQPSAGLAPETVNPSKAQIVADNPHRAGHSAVSELHARAARGRPEVPLRWRATSSTW